jgi:hypothetical protein
MTNNHDPEVLSTMADIHRLSEQVIDYAERAANVADAAKGKGKGNGVGVRWLILPAAGAALYAFIKSEFASRGAKVVADEAKTRASELPDDLMNAVRQTPQKTSPQKSSGSTRSRSRSRSGGQSRRRTSARRTTASSR